MTAVWVRAVPARFNIFVLLFGLVLALFLSGCSSMPLESDLSETHANEIVAVLSEAEVNAQKSEVGEGKWRVSVAQSDFAKSVDILRANGLPKEKFISLCEVYKKEGLSTTPSEERGRFNCSKTQELSETISKFEGVLSARVHLALPEPDPLSRVSQPSGASVYVKYRTGFDMRSKQAAIKTLVGNSIEGLNYDRVSVFMEPAQSLPVAKRKSESLPWGVVLRIIMGIIAVALLALAGRAWLRSRKTNSIVKVEP
jgi:type III secretion protein J